MISIQKNVSLASYSTMRLGGNAAFLAEITNENELLESLDYAKKQALKIHVVGGGSNTIFSENGFDGLVIVNKINQLETKQNNESLHITCGAGVAWDEVVKHSVERGYFDIAALSLIPGTAGAAPVQNIGAYGQQVSDSLISIRAYDLKHRKFIEIPNKDCGFSYRHSRFNTVDKGRFIVTSIELQLSSKNINPPFYTDVESYFKQHNFDVQNITAKHLREAVSNVRVIKLPDPSQVANCGSFFKNPAVSKQKFQALLQDHPELKAHQTDDGNLKLYGGQLIELCGLKGFSDPKTGMATWKNQALVLVNESAKTTEDLINFKNMIVDSVNKKFGIILIQEPEFII